VTYIPTGKGFLYLVAIMDWFSRKVLAWRLFEPICSALAALLHTGAERAGLCFV
jgi:transposase InsO family protein